MQTRNYLFYTTATQNAAAMRQIIAPGIITCVLWSLNHDAVADGNALTAELSFMSTLGATTDNAQGVISVARKYLNLVTSGIYDGSLNYCHAGLYIPIATGQMVFLNTTFTGAAFISALLTVAER